MSTDQSQQPTKFILTPDDIEKIKAEELLRIQIRNEIAPGDKPSKNKFLEFINSPFILLIISSVLITGIGNFITMNITKHNEAQALHVDKEKHLLELDNRVTRMRQLLVQSDTAEAIEKKKYYTYEITQVMHGTPGWYLPAYPEFNNIPLVTLLKWLSLNSKSDSHKEIIKTAIQLEAFIDDFYPHREEIRHFLDDLENYSTEEMK